MLKLSQSMINTWLFCRQAWYYKYIKKIEQRPTLAMTLGRLIHLKLEYFYGGKAEALFKEDFPPECEETADEIMKHYEIYALKNDDFQVLSAEHKFEIEIEEGIFLKGVIDLIVKRPDGLWLMEHKTTSNLSSYSEQLLSFDRQASLYLAAAWEFLNERPQGIIFNVIRQYVPKKGKDYIVRRFEQRRTNQELLSVLRNVELIQKDIKEEIIYRNYDRQCIHCSYKYICRAEMQGDEVRR